MTPSGTDEPGFADGVCSSLAGVINMAGAPMGSHQGMLSREKLRSRPSLKWIKKKRERETLKCYLRKRRRLAGQFPLGSGSVTGHEVWFTNTVEVRQFLNKKYKFSNMKRHNIQYEIAHGKSIFYRKLDYI